MLHGTRLLEDYISLQCHGIGSGTTFQLFERIIVWVKNTDGITRFFLINDGMTVEVLKKIVGDYFGHGQFNPHLVFQLNGISIGRMSS